MTRCALKGTRAALFHPAHQKNGRHKSDGDTDCVGKGRYIHNTLYVPFLSRSLRLFYIWARDLLFPSRALYGFIVLL